jgi:hypothetical protein
VDALQLARRYVATEEPANRNRRLIDAEDYLIAAILALPRAGDQKSPRSAEQGIDTEVLLRCCDPGDSTVPQVDLSSEVDEVAA